MTFAVVMSFTLSTFAVYGLRIGFSGDNALQSLETFTLSPYRISIFGYLAASVGIKLLAFSVFFADNNRALSRAQKSDNRLPLRTRFSRTESYSQPPSHRTA